MRQSHAGCFPTVQTLMNARPLAVSSAFKEKHLLKLADRANFTTDWALLPIAVIMLRA